MDNEQSYWQRAMRQRLSRRRLLQAGAVAGLGLAAGTSILGCNSGQPQQAAPGKGGETPQAAQPKYGGVLKLGYVASRGYLFPGLSNGGANDLNWELVIGDSMVYTAPDGSPDPDSSLAASWKREDDTTFTFNLRQNVKFHDGTDYDAAAQKTYLELLQDPNKYKTFAYRSTIETIKSMEVVDKYTLRVRLSRVDPALLANLGGQAGIPCSPTAIDKLGPDINARPPLTGPFLVKSFTPNGEWIFEKNPNYWRKGLPYLDGITFVEIPDDNVRAASVQSGQIDFAYFNTPSDASENLKKDPNLTVSECPAGPAILALNHTLPPFDNLKIRQAAAHCIDRETIHKIAFQGVGQVAKGGIVTPGSWGYKDVSEVAYKFDIDKAKQLIKDSGLKGSITIKIVCNDSVPSGILYSQLVKGWLADAGFDTVLDVIGNTEATRRMYDELSYHFSATTRSSWPDPHSAITAYCTSTSYYNAGRKSQDPVALQMDDLIKKAGLTYDQAERKKAYDQFQLLMEQNVFVSLQLVYRSLEAAVRKNVKGIDKMWTPAWGSFHPQFLWKE